MNRRNVIARVVESGQCEYYKAGRSFALNGFTPQGLCDSAYAALSRDAQVLAYGGSLPWSKDGVLRTHCPDCKGATWELKVAEEDAPPEAGQNGWRIEACRGCEGGCPNALTGIEPLRLKIETILRHSARIAPDQLLPKGQAHAQRPLRVALAACPNACSQPQVRTIGLIASVRPHRVTVDCTGCSQCAAVCREAALDATPGTARLDATRCVGCGQCATVCAHGALDLRPLGFRLLVGGRLGRHPRFGVEWPGLLQPAQVPEAVGRILAEWVCNARDREPLAVVSARMDPERLLEAALKGLHEIGHPRTPQSLAQTETDRDSAADLAGDHDSRPSSPASCER